MVSVCVAGDAETAKRIAVSTRVFLPTTSLGGVESLIEHRRSVEGFHSVVDPILLHLSIGIEDVNDLIADFEQALTESSERAFEGGGPGSNCGRVAVAASRAARLPSYSKSPGCVLRFSPGH